MVALGVDAGGPLQPGVHLRWSVDPQLGFPPLGFDLFRREHRPGSPRALDFTAEATGDLPRQFQRGATTWSTAARTTVPSFQDVPTNEGSVSVLFSAPGAALTCRFAASERPIRQIEVDVVHTASTTDHVLPFDLEIWGLSGGERVARGVTRLTEQNRWQILQLAVFGDRLDGFQFAARGLIAFRYGIVRVRWVLVSDEANVGWGAPINPQRIGFPVTAPGYLVKHAHSPDAGDGQNDWKEAADRLSPTGSGAQLPAQLAQRFGFPEFKGTRYVMTRALLREALLGSASVTQPRVELDPVRLVLVGAVDRDFARLAGLAMVDGAAAGGQRYDYKVVGYWPGRLRPELVCFDVPANGTTIPPGGSITIPGGGGGTPVVVTASTTGTTTTTTTTPGTSSVALHPSVAVPRGFDLASLPGLVVAVETAAEREGVGATPGESETGGAVVVLETGGPVAIGSPTVAGPPARRSLTFAFEEPTDEVRVVAGSLGPDPLSVVALAGQTVTAVHTAAPGPPAQVTVTSPGTTSIVVSGTNVTVATVCRLQLAREIIEETWICFRVVRGPAGKPPTPAAPEGRALPGFARDGRPGHLVGVLLESRPPAPQPEDLLPLARLPTDPVSYDLGRRADGAQPNPSPAGGTWLDLNVDPATGGARPLLRSGIRPPVERSPAGWPPDAQDFLDARIDPDVRFYSYRVRGRDLFGRLSDWSPPASVDAADRVAPPAPTGVAARWIETSDPWLESDDGARLAEAGAESGVRLRWAWAASRREQAPDARAFRVYWNGAPFSTVTGTVSSAQAAGDTYIAEVVLDGLGASLPVDAFAGDWLRQDGRQYRILASSAANPARLSLDATGVPAPRPGACAVSLRGPDPKRLDLLGNPLRRDSSSPLIWERRALQIPLTELSAKVTGETFGVPVTIAQVSADDPREGVATLTLDPEWTWGRDLPDAAELAVGRRIYPIIGGRLGATTATLLIDTSDGERPPEAGAAVLGEDVRERERKDEERALVRTLDLDAELPALKEAILLGGTAVVGDSAVAVLAHRPAPPQLVVLARPRTRALTWLPDYEVLLSDVSLKVDARSPHATGVVGVSAVDGRQYAQDKRQRQNEPGGPGNEGPVAGVSVRRDYRGSPTVQPAPAGTTTTGTGAAAELWAPVPDEFSGTSRFILRWPASGAPRFGVFHASVEAVLAAAQTSASGMTPQQLQQLATQHPEAFLPMSATPLSASDPLLADPQAGWLRWTVPLDGRAPGRHFLRVRAVDEAGNAGPFGPSTLPIVLPDVRRPATPRLRRAIDGDRAVWLQWDASDPGVTGYRIYRAQLASGSRPDVRDMTLIATLAEGRCPEPSSVFSGKVELSGPAPSSVVAVYGAEDYDPSATPGAQTATPLAGGLVPSGSTVSGLDVPDGMLVFSVVRHSPGGPAVLAAPATGRAYRDSSVTVGVPYQYRVEVARQAAAGPTTSVTIRSLPSGVGEAVAFDPRPPVPPQATASWQASQQTVLISWPIAGLPAALEVLAERMDILRDQWVAVREWIPAGSTPLQDPGAASGHTYLYRLRARNAAGRLSEDEPAIGPVSIP